MPPKECDPRCTGRCNKNRARVVPKSDKSCDPRCTGRCSKKHTGTSTETNVSVIQNSTFPETNLSVVQNSTFPETNVSVVQERNEQSPELLTTKDFVGDAESIASNKLAEKINAVIIDLDGVILDIETVYEWVIEDLVNAYGIPKDEVQHIIDLQDDETASKFCKDYQLAISSNDFMKVFRNISVKNLRNTPLMPGIENLMEHLVRNNIPVASASTSNEGAFKLKTGKHNNFFNKFSHIVLGGSDPEVTAQKPSPTIYNICGSRFSRKFDPNTILVLEDAPEGVLAAKKAGMKVVWIPNKYMKRDIDGADEILKSIREFEPQKFGLPPMK